MQRRFEKSEESEVIRKQYCDEYCIKQGLGWCDYCPAAICVKTFDEHEPEKDVCGFYRKPLKFWKELMDEEHAR